MTVHPLHAQSLLELLRRRFLPVRQAIGWRGVRATQISAQIAFAGSDVVVLAMSAVLDGVGRRPVLQHEGLNEMSSCNDRGSDVSWVGMVAILQGYDTTICVRLRAGLQGRARHASSQYVQKMTATAYAIHFLSGHSQLRASADGSLQ